MKWLLIWWAEVRLRCNRASLNADLRMPAVGRGYVRNQLENIENLERRIASLRN